MHQPNPYASPPPAWDPRSRWQKLRDGWRRAARSYLQGLRQMRMSWWYSCLVLAIFGWFSFILLLTAALWTYLAIFESP